MLKNVKGLFFLVIASGALALLTGCMDDAKPSKMEQGRADIMKQRDAMTSGKINVGPAGAPQGGAATTPK